MRYDLDDLRLFLGVVEEGSITAGARRSHLSLPSASARIRALEHHAGLDLLIRERRGVRPTPAGAALVRHVREVLAQLARLDSAVASYTRSAGTPVRLLVGASAMHKIVPAALVSFLREHPDIDVQVSESRTPRTVSALRQGQAALGILVDDQARDSGLRTEPLGDDSLVVIGPASGVLSGRAAMTYEEVAEHPMVGLSPGSSLRDWIDQHTGPSAPAVRYRTTVTDLGVVAVLAAAGAGLAVVPRRAVPAGHDLDVCELSDPWARRTHLLAWGTTEAGNTPGTVELAEHLRRAAHTSTTSSPSLSSRSVRAVPDALRGEEPQG